MIFTPIFDIPQRERSKDVIPSAFSGIACPLLALPQELRDEIYRYLVKYETHTIDCYDDIPRHNDLPRARKGRTRHSHIDRKIQLPLQYCRQPLALCHQLRAEFLDFLVAAYSKSGPVIITMDALRPVTTVLGFMTPLKTRLTPSFMRLRPVINACSDVHFRIWPGWNWWNGDQNLAVQDQLLVVLPHLERARSLTIELCLETWEFVHRDIDFSMFYERLQPFLGSTLRKPTQTPFTRALWQINLRTYDQDGIEPKVDLVVNLYQREEVLTVGAEIQVTEKIGKLAPDDWFADTVNGDSDGPPSETRTFVKSGQLHA